MLHCSNSADMVSVGKVGGIIGASGDASKIIACTNSGKVKSTTNSAAGIATQVEGSSYIFGCVNKGTTIETNDGIYAAGIVCTGAPVACWSIATAITTTGSKGAISGWVMSGTADNCYWKEISGVRGVGAGRATNFASFTENQPTPAQIAAMNAAWATAEPTGREYQFNATTGEIERIP